ERLEDREACARHFGRDTARRAAVECDDEIRQSSAETSSKPNRLPKSALGLRKSSLGYFRSPKADFGSSAHGKPDHLRSTHSTASSIRKIANVSHECRRGRSSVTCRVAVRVAKKSRSSEAFSGMSTLPLLASA